MPTYPKNIRNNKIISATVGIFCAVHLLTEVTLNRCESSHAFLKKYLGGKKTHQSLYTTWHKIKAAI